MKVRLLFTLLFLIAALTPPPRLVRAAAAQSTGNTIFVVRHAERADGGMAGKSVDPSLSEAGKQRAVALAAVLRDAQIRVIFVTEFKRTQETAAPLAEAIGIVPTIVTAKDTPTLVARVQGTTGNALVIGHSNTIPEVLTRLGGGTPIAIADDQYDDVFILTPAPKRALLRLHYP